MSPSPNNKYYNFDHFGPARNAEYFENQFGFGFKNKKFLCFFGNTAADVQHLQNEFVNLKFCRLKQTHSDLVIESTASGEIDLHTFGHASAIEADAHYTSIPARALCIATADCMPIMIWCEQTFRVAAVHAGWRGVENKILIKTLQKLIESGSSQKRFQIFVGPSIQQNSFEVDRDVYEKISAAACGLAPEKIAFSKEEKFHVDLNSALLSQIQFVAEETVSVTFSKIDTKTSLDFYSYRRGKLTKERNLSFACLLT